MKHLKELLALREEKIEEKQPEDIWDKDAASSYVSAEVFQVKQGKDGKWQVYSDKPGYRKMVGTFDTAGLEGSFSPIRSNAKPDAEGFVQYRDNAKVDAMQYDGDTVKIIIDDSKQLINKGDYLVRSSDDSDFMYDVQAGKDFESNFVKAE